MTEDIEVGRYSQAAPDHAAEFKEEKDTPMASEEKKRQSTTTTRSSHSAQPPLTHPLSLASHLYVGCASSRTVSSLAVCLERIGFAT